MSNTDLFPLGLNGFRVVRLRADPPSADQELDVTFRVGVFVDDEDFKLVGILTIIGENARGIAVVDGDAIWRGQDFASPFDEMDDAEIVHIVSNSFAIHSLYDAAAMTLRQSFGLLGADQHIDELTPEPSVDLIRGNEDADDDSESPADEVAAVASSEAD